MTSIVSKSHKKLESAFAGSSFFIGVMGFERPLRKHAVGMFLGRGRIHRFLNAPGTGVGIRLYWSQDRRMAETSKSSSFMVSFRFRPTSTTVEVPQFTRKCENENESVHRCDLMSRDRFSAFAVVSTVWNANTAVPFWFAPAFQKGHRFLWLKTQELVLTSS